jgi:uncharacterized protein with PIN domain
MLMVIDTSALIAVLLNEANAIGEPQPQSL